ncbi:SusC/RagA family TonB-linked outer membrane protein [Nonlabens sp.]|uniref:SusC/RagA family TonB-linked outer membrane protein n=1 Tax=Nonlabens sp. TaxID=1888209 RepID=UPI003F69812A
MKTKLNGILTLFLALIVQVSIAQTVTGKVLDPDGEPVLGATVLVKGTANATTTDFDGNYSINAAASDVLQFSFAGYDTQEVTVEEKSVINVTMATSLEVITLIGYRTATKETTNIASTTISSKTIENRPNASVVQTLTGQVAGLNIATNSGQPGGNSTINIRGVGSINGDSEPLFIIDGTFADQDNFRSLNPQDVESVTVLKDAGALAIYGNRGTNGVIIITTRRGEYQQPLKISVNSILSYTSLQDNDYNLLNSQQLLSLERERGLGVGGRGFDNSGTPLTDAQISAAANTDWTDVFFRTGVTQNQTVSLSSGGKKSTQFTSIGYFNQEGILQDSDLKRFNIRNNFSATSENDRFNFNTSFSANYSKSNEPNEIGGSGINRNYILGAYQSVPYLTPGDYTNGADLLAPLLFRNTPLFLLDRLATYDRFDEEVRILGNIDTSYKITDNITVKSNTGIDFTNTYLTRAEQSLSFNSQLFAADPYPTTSGFQQQNSNRTFAFNQSTSINYNKVFNEKHTLNVGLYTEYLKQHFRGMGYFANGLDPRTFELGDGDAIISDNGNDDFLVDTVSAQKLNGGQFSYFTAVDYDYDTRFGFSGVLRRDASYRFIGDNKWGTFFSVAGRWNIDKESFMDDVDFVKVLKLRGSYGVTGNQDVNGDGYFSGSGLVLDTFTTGAGYGNANSLFVNAIGNPTLQWEEVAQWNVGIDFELLNRGRLRGAVDVYSRNSRDLFQSNRISGVFGNGGYAQSANVGNLYNRGIDFDVKYDVVQALTRDDLGVTVGLNFNHNRSELQNLPNEDGEIIGIGRNGGQLGEYSLVRQVGVNPATGNLLFLDADGNPTETPDPDNDQVWSGKNLQPEFTGGFNFNVDYKGFYLETLFQFAAGIDRFDNDLNGFQDPSNIGQFNLSNDILRAWENPGDITDIPSLDATNLDFGSDRYLREADFLRLRFVNVGYSFDQSVISKFKLDRLRLFVNAENLITWSKWRGFDASTLSNTSRLYPTPRIISFGIELGL